MINVVAMLSLRALLATPPARRPAPPVDSAKMTLVFVENDRNVPVTVYAQDAWGERKLGVVAPHDIEALALDDQVGHEVEFFVKPAGQIEESTQPVEIDRGEHVGLIVPQR